MKKLKLTSCYKENLILFPLREYLFVWNWLAGMSFQYSNEKRKHNK